MTRQKFLMVVKGETAYLSIGDITHTSGEETPGKERRLMKEATQGSRWKSSDLWETLEKMVRRGSRSSVGDPGVTEFLGGRAKSQRRASVEGPKG